MVGLWSIQQLTMKPSQQSESGSKKTITRVPLHPPETMPESFLPADEKLEEMRGKIHLKERDGEIFVEETKNALTRNEKIILTLRDQNKKKRKILSQGMHSDAHVIRRALQDKPVEKMSNQYSTLDRVIYTMEQKVGEANKKFNLMLYELNRREKQLQQLEETLVRLLTLEYKDLETEQKRAFRRLENELDKSKVKNDAATNIKERYEAILHQLKVECHAYPTKLGKMEQELKESEKSLLEATEMKNKALNSYQKITKGLYEKERQIIQAKKIREKQLFMAKREAEKQMDTLDNITRRVNAYEATRLKKEIEDSNSENSSDSYFSLKEKMIFLEDDFDFMKTFIDVSDVKDLVSHVVKQELIRNRLLAVKDDIILRIAELHGELDKEISKVEHLKFTSDYAQSQAHKMVEEMEEFVQGEQERKMAAETLLKQKSKLKTELTNGIDGLCDKLKDIKISQPLFFKKDNLVENLSICEKKIDALLHTMDAEKAKQAALKRFDSKTLIRNYIDQILPYDNVRISFQDEEQEDEYMFDHDMDNEGVLTREIIKRRAWEFLKPKKKKGSKSNK